MKLIAPSALAGFSIAHPSVPLLAAQITFPHPLAIPVIKTTLPDGLGELHPSEPPEPEPFGQPAGVWDTE